MRPFPFLINGIILRSTIVFAMLTLLLSCRVNQDSRLFRSWRSDKHNVCLVLRRTGYSQLNELKYLKARQVGSRLKIIDYFGAKKLFADKSVYWFSINKLTDEELVLSSDLPPNQYFEYLPDSIMRFSIESTDSCMTTIPR